MDASNLHPQHPKAGPATRFLLKIAGVNEETLRMCPEEDWENVRAVAEIMLCTWLYQTALFALVAHRLFAPLGELRPGLILASMFVATFIMAIDSYMVMRSGWYLSGITELKRGGIDISGGLAARIKAGIFLAVRIALSIGLAQLLAIFASFTIFATDISAPIRQKYLEANKGEIAAVTLLFDGEVKRESDQVTAESASVAALSKQLESLRQGAINPAAGDPQIRDAEQEVAKLVDRKAAADDAVTAAQTYANDELGGIRRAPGNSGHPGVGPRYRAALQQLNDAKARAQEVETELAAARDRLDVLRKQIASADQTVIQRSRDQVPAYEAALKAENAKLTALKEDLARLIAGRESAIRKAVENSPNYVAPDDGLLAQLTALEHIAERDTKIALVIILIDAISFGFELAAVLSKITAYVPTSYAALLAKEAYLRVVRIADEAAGELRAFDSRNEKGTGADEAPPLAPADEPPEDGGGASLTPAVEPATAANDPIASPVKRGRGRPRKYPLPTAATGANGQEDPTQEPEPPKPV